MADRRDPPDRRGDLWADASPAVRDIGSSLARATAVVAAPASLGLLVAGIATGEVGAYVFAANGLLIALVALWIMRSSSVAIDWLFFFAAVAALVGGIVGEDNFVLGTVLAIGVAESAIFVIQSRVGRVSPVPMLLTFVVLIVALVEHAPELPTVLGAGGALAAVGALWWAAERFGADHRLRSERFHTLVDNGPSGMLLVSGESPGEIVYANASAIRLLGEPLVGESLDAVLDVAEGRRPRAARLPDAVSLDVTRDRVGDGSEVVHIRDLTDEVKALDRLRASEDRYRTLFDRVPVGLYTTSMDGRIVQANTSLAELLGYDSAEEVVGLAVDGFYVDHADRVEHGRKIIEHGSATAEYRIRTRDGRERWVRDHCSIAEAAGSEPMYYFGEMTDVSAERAATSELESTLRARERLIGAVSHELRTPLTAVLGLVRLLDAGEISDEDVGGVLDTVLAQTEDLHYIVEDLLAATRLQQGGLSSSVAPFVVAEEVEAVLSSVELGGRSVTVEVDPSLRMLGDAQRTRQILRNLLTNAWKYGGPTIRIRGTAKGEGVTLSVLDDGDGLAAAQEEEAFEPFRRLHTPSTDHGSLGLGLHLSRGLAESMGGELRYGREDGWSAFVLSLPAP